MTLLEQLETDFRDDNTNLLCAFYGALRSRLNSLRPQDIENAVVLLRRTPAVRKALDVKPKSIDQMDSAELHDWLVRDPLYEAVKAEVLNDSFWETLLAMREVS